VFRKAGVDPTGDRHLRALAAYHAFWEPHTFLDPDAGPLIRGLRHRGIRVGVLSNTLWTREYHERVFARDGVLDLIDGAVYSSEIPYTKPHPEAFLAAMRAIGVDDPAACVFVGDRPYDDVHGAKQVGMRAVLVPHSDIPPGQRGHVEGEPDAVVDRLADLLPVVERWSAGARSA
jgi:putative hydrolase of the HAD superfamily